MAEDTHATEKVSPATPEASIATPIKASDEKASESAAASEINTGATDDEVKPADSTTEDKAKDASAMEDASEVNKDEAQSSDAEKDETGQDETAATEKTPAKATSAATDTNGTPASNKKGKRKSSSGVPEHRSKKLNKKKSQILVTHLNAEPGDYYFARLKGHPPWPAIICDEEMLPNALLNSRPVTAKNQEGKYRDDFAEGGKRQHERTFAVMFMDTYEFGWIPSSDLSEIDLDTIGSASEKGKSKSLLRAYNEAALKKDLAYFKRKLGEHQEALRVDAAAKAAKKSSKASKSKATAAPDTDTEMAEAGDDMDMDVDEEVDEDVKSKGKKRKKTDVESDAEDKPAKTPKRGANATPKSTPKLKLSNPKTPTNGASKAPKPSTTQVTKSTPKSSTKPPTTKKTTKKKAAVAAADDGSAPPTPTAESKPLTPAELLDKKQKEILFLRHKLQKGFLTRDQPPKEEEMKSMSDYITKLETYTDLEVSIMRATKIHKVLRAIVKLEGIPRDAEFEFKHRSRGVLAGWTKALTAAEDGPGAEPEEKEKKQNGVRDEKKGETTAADDKAGEKTVEKDAELVAEKTEKESTGDAEKAETLKASAPEDAEPEKKPETETETEPKKTEEEGEGEGEAETDEA